MSELLDAWQVIVWVVIAACLPMLVGSLRRSESWSDRVSRERGWPIEARGNAAALEPGASGSYAPMDSGGSAGSDCGGDSAGSP